MYIAGGGSSETARHSHHRADTCPFHLSRCEIRPRLGCRGQIFSSIGEKPGEIRHRVHVPYIVVACFNECPYYPAHAGIPVPTEFLRGENTVRFVPVGMALDLRNAELFPVFLIAQRSGHGPRRLLSGGTPSIIFLQWGIHAAYVPVPEHRASSYPEFFRWHMHRKPCTVAIISCLCHGDPGNQKEREKLTLPDD